MDSQKEEKKIEDSLQKENLFKNKGDQQENEPKEEIKDEDKVSQQSDQQLYLS